jgi:hypothetical protein
MIVSAVLLVVAVQMQHAVMEILAPLVSHEDTGKDQDSLALYMLSKAVGGCTGPCARDRGHMSSGYEPARGRAEPLADLWGAMKAVKPLRLCDIVLSCHLWLLDWT